jgi:hypothetical protein
MRDVAPHDHTRLDACCSWSIAIGGPEVCDGRSRKYRRKEHLMLDVVMLVLGFSFFALGIGYAYACERL